MKLIFALIMAISIIPIAHAKRRYERRGYGVYSDVHCYEIVKGLSGGVELIRQDSNKKCKNLRRKFDKRSVGAYAPIICYEIIKNRSGKNYFQRVENQKTKVCKRIRLKYERCGNAYGDVNCYLVIKDTKSKEQLTRSPGKCE